MNFLDLKAGETIEVGTQKAYRFWRYVFPPHHAPVRLLSWVSDTRWHARQSIEGTTPDEGSKASTASKPWMICSSPFAMNQSTSSYEVKSRDVMGSCWELSRCGASFGITPKGTERSSQGPCLLFQVMAIGASRHWPSCVPSFPGKPRCKASG